MAGASPRFHGNSDKVFLVLDWKAQSTHPPCCFSLMRPQRQQGEHNDEEKGTVSMESRCLPALSKQPGADGQPSGFSHSSFDWGFGRSGQWSSEESKHTPTPSAQLSAHGPHPAAYKGRASASLCWQ
jgi:hypothetical protein